MSYLHDLFPSHVDSQESTGRFLSKSLYKRYGVHANPTNGFRPSRDADWSFIVSNCDVSTQKIFYNSIQLSI